MTSDMTSILKAILEAQEREIAWNLTSYQEAYDASTSREYQSFGVTYHPRNEWCEVQRPPSPLNVDVMVKGLDSRMDDIMTHEESIDDILTQRVEEKEEKCLPLEKSKALKDIKISIKESFEEEDQSEDEFLIAAEEAIMEIESQLGCTVDKDLVIRHDDKYKTVCISSGSFNYIKEEIGAVGKNLEDTLENVLVIEFRREKEEISIDDDKTSIKEETKLDNMQGEEESINEFEELFGYPSMEALNAKFEDDAHKEWILSTKEESHVISIVKKEVKEEEPMEKEDENKKEPPKRVQEEESLMVLSFDQDPYQVSTKEVSIDDQTKIPFEEIRMNGFRGWFYDEYEPGDSWLHQGNLKTKSS